ncbi:uncharacterized protein LOC144218872 isoform X3 [Crocuta crocuta]
MPRRHQRIRQETRLLGFIFSGVFAVLTERMRSVFLYVVSGIFAIQAEKTHSPKLHSGMILSAYLWLFSMLKLFLASTVTKWGNEASCRGNNLR